MPNSRAFFGAFFGVVLGVLTMLLTAVLSTTLVFAAVELPPPPTGFVYDGAQVLSQETEDSINAQLQLLEQENSTEIAVATVPTLQGYPIEEFALELARAWGIGQEDFNNGLLLLVAPTEHEVRIEVGYGLEGAIPDATAFRIIDDILLPSFQAENYDAGVLQAVQALDQLARGETFIFPESSEAADSDTWILVLIYALPFLYLGIARMSHTKSWWAGGIIGGAMGFLIGATFLTLGIGLAIGLLLDFFLSTVLFKKIKLPKGKGGGPFFGGGSGGGFSGGSSGGGFGGGGFGGGGASGRW